MSSIRRLVVVPFVNDNAELLWEKREKFLRCLPSAPGEINSPLNLDINSLIKKRAPTPFCSLNLKTLGPFPRAIALNYVAALYPRRLLRHRLSLSLSLLVI